MYTVAVSDQTAQDYMKKAEIDKLTKRWDHKDDGSDSDSDDSADRRGSDSTVVGGGGGGATGHRGPSPLPGRAGPGGRGGDNQSMFGRPSTESSRREDQVEEVRGLLRQESTQGRRRKAVPGNQPLR